MTAILGRPSGPTPSVCSRAVRRRLAVHDDRVREFEQRAHEGQLVGVLPAVVPEQVVGRPHEPDARALGQAQLHQRALGLDPTDLAAAARDVGLRPVDVDDIGSSVAPQGLHDRQDAT